MYKISKIKQTKKKLFAFPFSPDSLQVIQDLWSIGTQLGHYILGQDGKTQPNPNLLALAERNKTNKINHEQFYLSGYHHIAIRVLF